MNWKYELVAVSTFFVKCLAILLVFKSWPGDFFGCNLFIIVKISDRIIDFAGNDVGRGAFKKEYTKSSLWVFKVGMR